MYLNRLVIGKNQKLFIATLIFILAFFVFSSLSLAQGYGLDDTVKEVPAYRDDMNTELVNPGGSIPVKIGKVVGAVLAFVGIIFLILMIYGGLMWMTAQGNEQQVARAKDLIANSVIGLVIVLTAYAITAYVGSVLTGGN